MTGFGLNQGCGVRALELRFLDLVEAFDEGLHEHETSFLLAHLVKVLLASFSFKSDFEFVG